MNHPAELWTPRLDGATSTALGRFSALCAQRSGRRFDTYDDLWAWSVTDGLEDCWQAVWDFFGVEASSPFEQVLDARVMPGARWFQGARLNYAEHVLRAGVDRPGDIAVVAVSQSRARCSLTWRELDAEVRSVRAGLERLGVGRGDRVVAYMPNIPETIVAFLATASLGAICGGRFRYGYRALP